MHTSKTLKGNCISQQLMLLFLSKLLSLALEILMNQKTDTVDQVRSFPHVFQKIHHGLSQANQTTKKYNFINTIRHFDNFETMIALRIIIYLGTSSSIMSLVTTSSMSSKRMTTLSLSSFLFDICNNKADSIRRGNNLNSIDK